ncbi:MAG: hypothetical protein LBG74_04760 [Spirochaetaceae bacterium]|jgi:hypothetical protein|nr:hypothetical protein [Spirochaetaceae bacterium]
MKAMRNFCAAACAVMCALTAQACAFHISAEIPFTVNGNLVPLSVRSKKAVSGIFSLNKNAEYVYSLDTQIPVPENSALDIQYALNVSKPAATESGAATLIVKAGEGPLWLLPLSLAFMNIEEAPPVLRYKIPLKEKYIEKIHIKINGEKKTDWEIRIDSMAVTPLAYGFSRFPAGEAGSGIEITPFVKYESVDGIGSYLISVPDAHHFEGRVQVVAEGAANGSVIDCNTRAFSYFAAPYTPLRLTLPSAIIGANPYPVRFSGDTQGLVVLASNTPSFPHEPRTADPYFVLTFPQVSWRDERYEVFRWESFPSILIFDTASYEIQDRIFKRLAFFAEKKGYRGKLTSDAELASMHGWNAHDYNTQTLTAFYNLAGQLHFPITREEQELREILLANGIIRQLADGTYSEGEGAVISISRESNDYLRLMFMAHEGFHGIYFIDENFRAFTAERWNNLNRTAKRFIVSYFDYQQYDINDTYLLVNEFMAYVMQQSAGAAAEYFGKTIAERIEASDWRRTVLPAKDAAGVWPALAQSFDAEARAFSDYARGRWGLDCGRVWRVRGL